MTDIKNELIKKLIKTGEGNIASDQEFFSNSNHAHIGVPSLDIAFSGDINGGLTSGLTVIAGESRTFKTCMCLVSISAYMREFPESICIFYDSEFGTTEEYMKSFGIDLERLIHIPVEHIEQLKFDIVKKLDNISKGDKVIFFIDSLGNIASKKEIDDAVDEKSVADMSRAKAMKSLFRIITPKLLLRDLPCLAVAHVYKEMGLFPRNIIGGGSGILYAANTAIIVTKSQNKVNNEVEGFTFTLNMEKSRYIREKAKIPLTVNFEGGIDMNSGILELALKGGFLENPSSGWYKLPEDDTKIRKKDLNESFEKIKNNPEFSEFVKSFYKLGTAVNDSEFE